jgi:hypothetical protein
MGNAEREHPVGRDGIPATSPCRKMLKSAFERFPYWLRVLIRPRKYQAYLDYQAIGGLPPGHFGSPLFSREDIKEMQLRESEWFHASPPSNVPGIDLNHQKQIELLEEFKTFYRDMPFTAKKRVGTRYFLDNPWFPFSDGIFLYSMIRHAKPEKIIEIGSGFSSAVILDTNELFFDNSISCTFIEPRPQRLFSLLKERDKQTSEIVTKPVQKVDPSLFAGLVANDILFIDSSHVSKMNSDVNYLLFEVLPRLQNGVLVHFHDIQYPFEYPQKLIYSGSGMNEAYLLRAFLQFNSAFEVVMFNSFLQCFNREEFVAGMPLCLSRAEGAICGGSLWLKKSA